MMEKIWHKSYDKQVLRSIPYPDQTVYQLFQDSVDKNPQGIATLFFGAKIRYLELGNRVDRFASGLASMGIGKGDRVALVLPNIPAYPIAHLAVLKLGGILVPTNPLYVERELQYQLCDSGAETVVILDQLYPRLAAVRDKTPVKRVILARIQDFLPRILAFLYGLKHKSEFDPAREEGVHEDHHLRGKSFPRAPAAKISPQDTAIFLYTGGTTRVSKGAVLTHRNLVVNACQTREWLWDMEDRKEYCCVFSPFSTATE